MQIIHNIGLRVGSREKSDFSKAGVELEIGISSFKIVESDPRYEKIAALALAYRAIDTVITKFSPSELYNAKYLAVDPSWHFGYPEPADDNGFLKATFDLSDYCRSCGVGKRQIAPFRLKKPPIWGKRSVLQLNWIFDEYFTKPDLYEAVFKPHGIKFIPVVRDKNGVEIDSIVQLDIPSTVDLKLQGVEHDTCSDCGRKKYLPFSRGFYPSPLQNDFLLFKSSQYFGSGARAYRMVLVSSFLYGKIVEANLTGVDFRACSA